MSSMKRNEVAAAIHKRMVGDDRFGYSWDERYGANIETWEVGGEKHLIAVGDYDCSSSTITAWRKALEYTPYEGVLDAAVTTHNMRSVFLASGLFNWVPVSQAGLGDLYLNDANHVAMCQGNGQLSEFSWGDNGAHGNMRGDQSGWEAHMCGYYDYPWNGCLKYNGMADSQPKQEPGQATNDNGIRYRAHVQNLGWCDWVHDGQQAGTTSFGLRLECLHIEVPEGVELRVKLHVQNKGWVTYPTVTHDKPQVCGTTGQSLRIEAVIIEALKLPKGKWLEYCVHQRDIGWKAWTPAGYATGSDGQGMRLEAIRIRLV